MYPIQTLNACQSPGGLASRRYLRKSNSEIYDHRKHDSPVSLSDLSKIYPEAILASSKDLGWQNIRVMHVRNESGDMDVPALENHCVIVKLEPSVHVTANINGYDFDGFLGPDDIAIIPAGMASNWHWSDGRSHEMLYIYLEPSFLQTTAENCTLNYDQTMIEPQIGVRDEQLSHLAMSLFYELKAENIVGRLYADSVASVLGIQLVRHYSCLKDIGISKGGMAPNKLRRVLEFIKDKLDQQDGIDLDALAHEVRMSRFHFSRVFKESMGLSPINYIVRQRIERAKKLLAETDLPIADIALRSGFSGQSHFTTFFGKLVGVTPRSFRRVV